MNLQSNPRLETMLLTLLLVVFCLAALTYSIVTPLFEMSDEFWHYPMVKTLADGNGLPVQEAENPGPWKQEGSQPPLYYYLAAAITAWIDTSDVNEVLRPNPHVDNGVITPDGNNNLVVHNYSREVWPWYGAVLAVHIARFLSVLAGIGAVYFTYRTGLEIFPERRWLALAGAATVAFTPMFAFISGAVNNDSLSVMVAAAALWLMMRIARQANAGQPTMRLSLLLGITLGIGALTKTSTLGLFGLAGATMAYAAWTQKRWQTFLLEGPLIIGIAAAIAGWWYIRNVELYGDPLGLSAFIAVLGQRARPASLLQLWGERFGFMQSYWGLFGGVNIPMPGWIYSVLNWLAILSVIGAVVALILKLRRDRSSIAAWMPAALSLLWVAGVVLPLSLSWARITWSSQGRLVFAAIGCISIWFIAGLSSLFPKRWSPYVAGGVLAFLGVLTLAAPFAWISPRYRLPAQAAPSRTEPAAEFAAPGAAPAMRLLEVTVSPSATSPGQAVIVRATWESLAPMDRDWSVFVHLEDTAGLLAGQRDMYPGQGLIATSDISKGTIWTDTYVIPVAQSAYAPEQLDVKIGLYDYASCPAPCSRMLDSSGDDTVRLGHISLLPSDAIAEVQNPVALDFGGEMKLVGYALTNRTVQAGDSFGLDLFWRAIQQMSTNYTVSVQLLGPENRIFAQKDSWPLDGSFPTTAWEPGELVADQYQLEVNSETPPGVYDIQIVIYSVDDGGNLERLQLITDDGRLTDDFVTLTQLRVVP
jgi:4-amino-4-deoxy-L-arabinose transferase-like glycosyltransferase